MQNRNRPGTALDGRGGGLRLRRPTEADLKTLVDIEAACFANPWPATSLAAELFHDHARLVLAEQPAGGEGAAAGSGEPRPVGYAAYRAAAGEAELLRLAVLPAARRQGVATALLAAGDEALSSAGAEVCYLEVREDNRAARAFYEKAGFHAIGVRPGYYADGDDARLLARAVGRGRGQGDP